MSRTRNGRNSPPILLSSRITTSTAHANDPLHEARICRYALLGSDDPPQGSMASRRCPRQPDPCRMPTGNPLLA
jgi:hypothetical protein